MGLKEFEENWDALATRIEYVLGLSVSDEFHPALGWMARAKRSYLAGDRHLGCAQAAYAKFVVDDLEKVLTFDEKMFCHFKRELRGNLPAANYFGIRQELRLASALLTKSIPFDKTETPDFIVLTEPNIGIECTSTHLSEAGKSKPDVAYKVTGAISKKSKFTYSTELLILVIDMSNLLFHEGLHSVSVLSQKKMLTEAVGQAVQSSAFQSVLTFSYVWVPNGIGNGATLTSYYSRTDRSDITLHCKAFLDCHYPLGDIWVNGYLHRRV